MYRQSENLLNSNISSICPLNIVNFGSLMAEICWRVWGTTTNFNWFCVSASLLHRRRSTEVNKTLQNVWPSTGLVHYIYIFGGSCPLTDFCQLQNSLCVQVLPLLYWQRYCTALEQRPSAKHCGVVKGIELRNVRTGRHLYSTGRPSRWALAHILVVIIIRPGRLYYVRRCSLLLPTK